MRGQLLQRESWWNEMCVSIATKSRSHRLWNDLWEDLIQESMGSDFRNLSGAEKPLTKFEHNP